MTVYRVIRPTGYRGHTAGTQFEATLDLHAEARAVARGDIKIVERSTPSLRPGSYLAPPGWLTRKKEG